MQGISGQCANPSHLAEYAATTAHVQHRFVPQRLRLEIMLHARQRLCDERHAQSVHKMQQFVFALFVPHLIGVLVEITQFVRIDGRPTVTLSSGRTAMAEVHSSGKLPDNESMRVFCVYRRYRSVQRICRAEVSGYAQLG